MQAGSPHHNNGIALSRRRSRIDLPMQRVFNLLFLLATVTGCSSPGHDSHTEVFKTSEEVAADRLARQLQSHKELAVSVLRFSRPDVEVKPADAANVTVSADGVTQP